MAERSTAEIRFQGADLPLYAGALATAEAGVRTGGDARNREHLEGRIRSTASPALEAIAFDPQTSGGLLAAVDSTDVPALEAAGFVVVGSVEAGTPAVSLL